MLPDINRKPTARAMSALPPKADIDWLLLNVRFVPIADIIDISLWHSGFLEPLTVSGNIFGTAKRGELRHSR